jgi:hypothetical protein
VSDVRKSLAPRWYVVAVIVAVCAPIAGVALLSLIVVALTDQALHLVDLNLVPILYVCGFALIVLGLNGVVWTRVIRAIRRAPEMNPARRIRGTLLALVLASPFATFILGVVTFVISGMVVSAFHG